jgi:hypothetical protein
MNCPICLEDRKNETVLECSHVFCKKCIDTWSAQKPTCPICRAAITYPDKFHFIVISLSINMCIHLMILVSSNDILPAVGSVCLVMIELLTPFSRIQTEHINIIMLVSVIKTYLSLFSLIAGSDTLPITCFKIFILLMNLCNYQILLNPHLIRG